LLAGQGRHTLLRVDLSDAEATAAAVRQADQGLVMHLATESHVDRSIEGPGEFIEKLIPVVILKAVAGEPIPELLVHRTIVAAPRLKRIT